jgi:hypothetical protein
MLNRLDHLLTTNILVAITHLTAGGIIILTAFLDASADLLTDLTRVALIFVLVGTAFLLIRRDVRNNKDK